MTNQIHVVCIINIALESYINIQMFLIYCFLLLLTDMVEIDVAFEKNSTEGVDKFHNITFTADGSFEIPFTININFYNGTAKSMYVCTCGIFSPPTMQQSHTQENVCCIVHVIPYYVNTCYANTKPR